MSGRPSPRPVPRSASGICAASWNPSAGIGRRKDRLLSGDGAGELGKKLDFLLQEMHREANTMLSKTPGVESEALAITGLALEIKAEIEKLREQVQNIE